jgi:hypothetical protein
MLPFPTIFSMLVSTYEQIFGEAIEKGEFTESIRQLKQ